MPRPAPAVSPVPLPPGLRSTQATRALLARLAAQPKTAMSAAEAEGVLLRAGVAVNRVTVYRLLDRLAAAGVLRRQVDAQRVARFVLAAPGQDDAAPRFECEGCHRQFPLSDGSARMRAAVRQMLQALASAGHEDLSVDIAVRGRCTGCAHPHTAAA